MRMNVNRKGAYVQCICHSVVLRSSTEESFKDVVKDFSAKRYEMTTLFIVASLLSFRSSAKLYEACPIEIIQAGNLSAFQ